MLVCVYDHTTGKQLLTCLSTLPISNIDDNNQASNAAAAAALIASRMA